VKISCIRIICIAQREFLLSRKFLSLLRHRALRLFSALGLGLLLVSYPKSFSPCLRASVVIFGFFGLLLCGTRSKLKKPRLLAAFL
jgi:hypothetical protein